MVFLDTMMPTDERSVVLRKWDFRVSSFPFSFLIRWSVASILPGTSAAGSQNFVTFLFCFVFF